jgi:hypothetical protein
LIHHAAALMFEARRLAPLTIERRRNSLYSQSNAARITGARVAPK